MVDQQSGLTKWNLELSKYKQDKFPEMTKADHEIQDLLNALNKIEDEIAEFKSTSLQTKFESLCKKVEAVLLKQKEENIARQSDIQCLKKDLENLKEEKVALEKKLAVAQVT